MEISRKNPESSDYSVYDTGLHLDAETEALVQENMDTITRNFDSLKTLFGPLTRKDRTHIPPILLYDSDNSDHVRVYGANHPENYAELAKKMYSALSSIGFDQLRDVIVVAAQNGRVANLDNWSGFFQTKLKNFMEYAFIEELTHSIVLKYPPVEVHPTDIDAGPGTYGELVKRISQFLADDTVCLDPAEFWVGFSINHVDPSLSEINDKALDDLLTYLGKLERGETKPDKFYLRYATEHLTTRAAFSLIKQTGGLEQTIQKFPDILTCTQQELMERYVLPIKYPNQIDMPIQP